MKVTKEGEKPTPANKALNKAMEKMHQPMMNGIMNPDPDMAFVLGMLPHHQGAVDMAKVELRYGKDPALRQLAERIINEQEDQMRVMQNWIKKQN